LRSGPFAWQRFGKRTEPFTGGSGEKEEVGHAPPFPLFASVQNPESDGAMTPSFVTYEIPNATPRTRHPSALQRNSSPSAWARVKSQLTPRSGGCNQSIEPTPRSRRGCNRTHLARRGSARSGRLNREWTPMDANNSIAGFTRSHGLRMAELWRADCWRRHVTHSRAFAVARLRSSRPGNPRTSRSTERWFRSAPPSSVTLSFDNFHSGASLRGSRSAHRSKAASSQVTVTVEMTSPKKRFECSH
jgi:hypothetical protein